MSSPNSAANSAIVSYVPALHAGYISFFSKYSKSHVFVLGKSFINAFPRLNRDLRALNPKEVVTALSALGISASVLEKKSLKTLTAFKKIVVPDEDVTRDFVSKYLKNKKVAVENIFLRWDAVAANKKIDVEPAKTISTKSAHKALMRRALTEAARSPDWWRQIGSILVCGKKIFQAHTKHFPTDASFDIFGTPRITVDWGERPDLYITLHSEADCIVQAAQAGVSTKGASLYASTFPCVNCALLIARSGIKKLYYAHGYSNLNGEEALKSAGVEIIFVQT